MQRVFWMEIMIQISTKRLDKYFKSLYTTIMETLTELKKFDAVLRMSRFSTKRKGNDKKRLSKKLCRKKVSWEK